MAEQTIDTGTNQLLCTIRDSVAIITLNRPEARNAYSPEIREALPAMINRMLDDPEVGALLLTGARRRHHGLHHPGPRRLGAP